MKAIGRIHWHEGLFLRPQHFQQHDLYLHDRLHDVSSLWNPNYWGIETLRVANSRLAAQVFEVEQCALCFADGTRVMFPKNALMLQRSFEGAWGANATRLPVCIGLRKLAERQDNMSKASELSANDLVARLNQKRYAETSAQNSVPDIFIPDSGESIGTLTYNLQLFFGKEIEDAVNFDKIKIAEIVRNGSEIRLAEDFVPPVMKIKSSPLLHKWLRDIREQLTSKARELALHKNDRLNESAMGQREMFYLFALQILNRFVPWLHHNIEEGEISPQVVYLQLVQMAGELSTLSFKFDLLGANADGNEPSLPVYDHAMIASCFRKAIRVVGAIMDEITAGPDYVTTMLFDGTYFYSDVNTRIFQGQNRFYLHVKTELDTEQVVALMGAYAKIASRELLPILVARSLAGIPLEHVSTPPSVLPRTGHSHYFEIHSHADVWTSVKEMQNLAVYLDNPPQDMEMELMVIYG
ncbi:MAG: type VI secretion system baseplate subunit TssK [Gammaproteobacteria bacterium]|nr:type VI secretion system baseplate subunit TssK [Gammaproteobacteria bacterium]